MPSYSIHVVEPTRRSGSRRTCAFQSPIRKSKSCEPSRSGANFAGAGETEGAGDCCPLEDSKPNCNSANKQIERDFMKSSSDLRSTVLFFELDQNHVQRLIANVLRGVSQRIAIKNVARLQFAFRGFAIRRVIAIPAAFQNVNHVGRMRMDLLLHAGRQRRFENANTIVLELHLDGFGINDCWILRVRVTDPNGEWQRDCNCED